MFCMTLRAFPATYSEIFYKRVFISTATTSLTTRIHSGDFDYVVVIPCSLVFKRIIGSNAGYVGYDSNQEAPFDTLETNPYRVIVLDELEKADPSIQTFFMAALEEGYAITNKNTKIDFSRTIIIATTNAGQITQKKTIGFNTNSKISKSDFIDDLKKYFRLEFLNRFHGNLFQFNSISEDVYREIINEIYAKEYENIITKKDAYKNLLSITIPNSDLDEIVTKTYTKTFNARPAKDAVREYITEKLI